MTSGSLGGFSLHSVSTADLSPGGASFAQAWSDVTIWDRVTLTNSTDGVLHVPIAVHFDGYATWRGSASYGLEIRGSDFTGEDRRRLGDSIDGYGTGQGAFYDLGGTTELVLSPHSVGTFKFIAGLSTRAIMGDDNSSPAVADFGHTMKMQWALPTGVTYTSQSGAFSPARSRPCPSPAPLPPWRSARSVCLRRRATKK